jgi:hypothetical protein
MVYSLGFRVEQPSYRQYGRSHSLVFVCVCPAALQRQHPPRRRLLACCSGSRGTVYIHKCIWFICVYTVLCKNS